MLRSIACWSVASLLLTIPPLDRVGRLEEPAIREASGIVQSRKHPGIFWVHNDSGNPAVLFAVRRDGSLIRSYKVEAPNVDWEDIAIDDAGHLYLGDIGNNKLKIPIRAIYRIDEPDPKHSGDIPLKVNASIYYKSPDSGAFDAESLFIDKGLAYLVGKRTDGKEADLYRVTDRPSRPPAPPTTPVRVGPLAECVEPATGADLSADGQRLAVVTDSAARVYEPKAGGGWALVATVRFTEKDVEAICWEGRDLIMASEDRSIYRISEATWDPKAKKGRER